MFRSVGKFTPDEVDKTAFVRVDLPAFFGDDKSFLSQSFNGDGDKIAVLQNAIARQNRQGNALLDDIPDARKVGGIMENLWLELLPVKFSQHAFGQDKFTTEQHQGIGCCFGQGDARLIGQRMAAWDTKADGPSR